MNGCFISLQLCPIFSLKAIGKDNYITEENPVTVCRLLRLNQYRNLTRKAEEKVYLRNDKKDPDRKSVKERGLKSTLFWVKSVK